MLRQLALLYAERLGLPADAVGPEDVFVMITARLFAARGEPRSSDG